MKLVISVGLALFLVVTGGARSLGSDDTDKIAAADKNGGTETLSEASESCDDDQQIESLPLTFAVTSNDSSPFASLFISETSVQLNSTRDNSRIYRLTSRFLI